MSEFPSLFPDPPEYNVLGPCRWCGDKAVTRVAITPARYTTQSGVKLIAAFAIEAEVCVEHLAMVMRNVAERDAEAEAIRAARAARKGTNR